MAMTPVQSAESSEASQLIEFEGVSKSFGAIQALNDVSFSVERNQVHALMGDNGAGKSTLIKILSGVLQQTSGEIYFDGERADFSDHTDAQSAGIETIYQDLAIAPNRSVSDNIFLGKELLSSNSLFNKLGFVDEKRMRAEATSTLERLDIDVDPTTRAGSLSGGQQQSVAIGRALQSDPDLLIMDEPTSALSVGAVERILDLIEQLQSEGITIVLISHNLEEVFDVADRVTVLASGEVVGTRDIEDLDEELLTQMMMGLDESEI